MRHELEPSCKWEVLALEANYRPAELARLCAVSLRTLQRHFQSEYKMTISHWLRAVRLQKAYGRLTSGDRVKEVALDLGFKQLSHFSREFKRFYGVPPRFLTSQETSRINIAETPQIKASEFILAQ
jgi:AraC-like DNA-binding protein